MSGKKHPRSEVKFNFGVINELRSVICVETFRMIAQQSMTVAKQRDTCVKLYHGENEVMGQAEKFMKRLSIYSDMWEVEQSKSGPRYFIPERLHQQYGKILVAGDNITESLICRLYEKNPDEKLSGQAIISKAKEAVKEAKKMHGLMSIGVKEGILQKTEGGEYGFPSGRTEDDFDQWLLKRLFNWDKHYGASGKQQFNDSTVNTSNNQCDGGGEDENTENKESDVVVNDVTNDTTIEEDDLVVPNNIFADEIQLNTSSVADDAESTDVDPPQNYLPRGWVLFKTRGLMSMPVENRLDFFSESLAESKRNIKHGRDHFRKEVAKEKAASRDFAFDDLSTSVSSKDTRGVSAVNRKFALRAAQRDAQLSLQHFEADLLKVNSVLKSKHGQRDSHLEMAKLHIALDEKEEAKKELAMAKAAMSEITELEVAAMKMDSKLPTKRANTLAGDAKINSGENVNNN